MKHLLCRMAALLLGVVWYVASAHAQMNPYTYDTQGWAAGTRGGQGGRIIRVTHLNASGPGSYREALEAEGPRIVVFEVGGVIDMGGKNITIRNPYLTIAGQTAPAPGITVVKSETNIATHDVIIQHMMFRPGEFGRAKRSGHDQDGISTQAGAHHIIVDHCSLSWATDENLSVGGPRFEGAGPAEWRRNTSHAITYSYNLVYEGLANSVHEKGEHSKGTLVHDNATGILLYGNVYASNRERNALFKGGVHAAMVNNLVFNPGQKAVHYNLVAHEWSGHEYQTGKVTLVGNVYRQGPDTKANTPLFALGGHGDVELYLQDNVAVDEVGQAVEHTGVYTASRARIVQADTAYLPPDTKIHAAHDLERNLPLVAGARSWQRDPIDFKLLSDVAEGRGLIIDSEVENAMGYPRYTPTRRAFDPADWNLHDMSPKAGWASLARPKVLQQARVEGVEGQRKADLGDGRYLNPIMAGDHPDPSILKDGDDYYMTFSSFEANPGLMIWHSRDLVNWQPIGPALTQYIGSVWAPELTKHGDRYYIYIPVKQPGNNNIYVVHAKDIRGPWSTPVVLNNERIDPGHVVGEDGRRYLFLSHGDRVQLSEDGLSTVGPMTHVYDGWQYPEEWDVESYSQEGPKMLRRGDYFYMTLALGGTAGPPTGHMVVSARSKSIHGPWENSPYNPILRTQSASEKWWSKGHATLVEGPSGKDWYMLYHGYENGFYTLGRQTLLRAVEWTPDGWFKARDGDDGLPLPKPAGGQAVPHGLALSDDFSTNKFGVQWSFYRGGADEMQRVRYKPGYLELRAQGDSPANSTPLTFLAGDQAYTFEVDVDFDEGAQAGVLLFYNDKLYTGLGVNHKSFVLHRYGMDQRKSAKPPGMANTLRMRLTNNRHIVSIHTSIDQGRNWHKYGTQMEISGYHHNVAYGFMSLRPALYAAGTGAVRFSNLTYRALP